MVMEDSSVSLCCGIARGGGGRGPCPPIPEKMRKVGMEDQ